MLRALKIGGSVINVGVPNVFLKNRMGWQHLTSVHRFYSKKDDNCPEKCPPCNDEPVCKPPKPISSECKPDEPKRPCAPLGDECQKRPPLTSIQDCPKPNLMDNLPKPDCPYATEDTSYKKYFRNILMLGTLIFLGTCVVFYVMQQPKKKKPKKKSTKLRRPKLVKKVPAKSSDIPSSVPYLLIGGGTASFSAFRAIKSAEPEAKVLVITSEGDFPYMRPPLSKEIWYNPDKSVVQSLMFKQWNGTERSIFYEPKDFYTPCPDLPHMKNGGVAVAQGWTISHIDVVNRQAVLEDGYVINYEKCLIATGATPRNLDIFENADHRIQDKVTLYRNIFDFQELHQISDEAQAIAIVGGGFLGSELACSLAKKGAKQYKVYQIFKEGGNMGKILPEYLSFWTTEKIKKEGVEIIPFAEVTGVKLEKDDMMSLNLSNGRKIMANHVIVSIGVEPNTELAEKSDLEVDPELGGFLVNTELQARSHLYIAGDCCCFYDTKLGRRRVEHHDHAVVSGRLAGENMAGGSKPYLHQSMFWSDLGPDVGYEAIGIVDSSLPTVGVFAKATSADSPQAVVTATDEGIRSTTEEKAPPDCKKLIKKDPEALRLASEARQGMSQPQDGEDFGKGVIFYLRDDIVVGIVLWNVFNRMNIARQVLQDERKYDDLNEVAKLFNIHDEE